LAQAAAQRARVRGQPSTWLLCAGGPGPARLKACAGRKLPAST